MIKEQNGLVITQKTRDLLLISLSQLANHNHDSLPLRLAFTVYYIAPNQICFLCSLRGIKKKHFARKRSAFHLTLEYLSMFLRELQNLCFAPFKIQHLDLAYKNYVKIVASPSEVAAKKNNSITRHISPISSQPKLLLLLYCLLLHLFLQPF